jgi:glycosyltransferase involved in cell wall biosynthesis
MSLKFTVVTVAYNAESVIEKTLTSVLNQAYLPYEYFIIDGKSSDKTVEIAKKYLDDFANKGVKYTIISEADSGIYNAMNKGIDLATGDFISFLNAGDWYEIDSLKNINEFYNEEEFELTYGSLNYINPDGSSTIKTSKLDSFPVSSRHWNHPSMFLKTDIYKKYKFDETFEAYADFNLYLKLRKDGTKIRVIDKVITNFVADGVSTNRDIKKVLERSKEKYKSYIHNGYGKIYFFESYGWEVLKAVYFMIRS